MKKGEMANLCTGEIGNGNRNMKGKTSGCMSIYMNYTGEWRKLELELSWMCNLMKGLVLLLLFLLLCRPRVRVAAFPFPFFHRLSPSLVKVHGSPLRCILPSSSAQPEREKEKMKTVSTYFPIFYLFLALCSYLVFGHEKKREREQDCLVLVPGSWLLVWFGFGRERNSHNFHPGLFCSFVDISCFSAFTYFSSVYNLQNPQFKIYM